MGTDVDEIVPNVPQNNPFIRMGDDGKPVFTGKDEEYVVMSHTGKPSLIECPVCGQEVDYLLGDDTNDGGRRGCEKCWKPSKGGVKK